MRSVPPSGRPGRAHGPPVYGLGVSEPTPQTFPFRLPFAGPVLDQAADQRADQDLIPRLRGEASTRVMLVHRDGPALTGEALTFVDAAALASIGDPDPDDPAAPLWLFLGFDGGAAGPARGYLALVLPDDGPAPGGPPAAGNPGRRSVGHGKEPMPGIPGAVWAPMREALAALPAWEAGLAMRAVALANWHRARWCPWCGGPTVVTESGWVRRCPAEGRELFPRTDPAVIMAVVDRPAGVDRPAREERILLGRPAVWPEARYSTLAGFVEPGESAEQAVRREVLEEVAVDVDDVAYLGSQPWPFPASLMLAFEARARTTEVRVDGVEVVDARWFTRPGLTSAVAAGEISLPPRASIARALIEHWLGAALPGL